jgi:hypothetical protein
VKARVLIATKTYRIVRGGWEGRFYYLEKRDGRDATGAQRWEQVDDAYGPGDVSRVLRELVEELGEALTRRERQARERRRKKAGGAS